MKRWFIYLTVLFNVFVLSPFPALADAKSDAAAAKAAASGPSGSILKGLSEANAGVGYNTSLGLATVVGRLISVILGAVGIIFIIIIVYGGILYMTSSGEEGKVKTAKKMIVQAIIGIIIIVGAYAISSFVLTQLGAAVA